MPDTAQKRADFRKLHESGFFMIPNPWDAGSAKRLAAMGFKALASTSAGAAWALGKEDGELTVDEAVAHLRGLVDACDLPVNADFENGFADVPEAVARNAVLAAGTGIAGLSIEDWSGTAIYDRSLAVERIAAVRAALDPDVILVARHENFRDPGRGFDEALERIVAYAEAGADCLFVPGIADPAQVAELVQAVGPKPFNVSLWQVDDTIEAYKQAGVRRCSVGGTLAGAAYAAAEQLAGGFKAYEA